MPQAKPNKCVDCGTPVWHESQRCRACYVRGSSAEQRFCVVCGKSCSRKSKHCRSCADSLRKEFHPATKHRCRKCGADCSRYSEICRSCWWKQKVEKSAAKRLAECPDPNPSGLCMCGCGGAVPIAKESSSRRGIVAGGHMRYLKGHHMRAESYRGRNWPAEEYRVDESTGCWIWQHGRSHKYGRIQVGPYTRKQAHIVYWERLHGPVPEGKELHHRCENKLCVNHEHLLPVTRLEHKRLHKKTHQAPKKAA